MEEDEPSYDICVTCECGDAAFDTRLIQDAVSRALMLHRCSAARIGVALVNDPHIAKLNQKYLSHEGPTDVLSFDLNDPDNPGVDGEIVISTDTARREAHTRNHDPTVEVLLYALHGTLHLLGLDDASETQAAEMHEIEDRVLSDMGFGPVFKRDRE